MHQEAALETGDPPDIIQSQEVVSKQRKFATKSAN
jgi:hypothetical protein